MRDFMGLNTHTVQFKPEQYAPVGKLARDYHPVPWDFGDSTANQLTLPRAQNGVHWQSLYSKWIVQGWQVHLTAMFGAIKPGGWYNTEKDAYRYGLALAQTMGPKAGLGPGGKPLATSVGIGNENGSYSDAQYRRVFKAMASGLRAGDPNLPIATSASIAGPSDKYYRSLSVFEGLYDLVDVVTCHSYAQAKGWPTWRRSFPEDPSIDFLKHVQSVLDWRDQNLPGKPVWVCEFGWDTSTKPNHKEGAFTEWEGSTDLQQAQWLVRSFLLFAEMGVDRAYIYFFDDQDKPSVHAAAGLTRNGEPKPSFWAVSHLQQTLGGYRLIQAIKGDAQSPAYQFTFEHEHNKEQRIVVVWSPTSGEADQAFMLRTPGFVATAAHAMPVEQGPSPKVSLKPFKGANTVAITATESPTYITLKRHAAR